MAQERSAGAEYFTEFNPEKFAEDFTKKMMAESAQSETSSGESTSDAAESSDGSAGEN